MPATFSGHTAATRPTILGTSETQAPPLPTRRGFFMRRCLFATSRVLSIGRLAWRSRSFPRAFDGKPVLLGQRQASRRGADGDIRATSAARIPARVTRVALGGCTCVTRWAGRRQTFPILANASGPLRNSPLMPPGVVRRFVALFRRSPYAAAMLLLHIFQPFATEI